MRAAGSGEPSISRGDGPTRPSDLPSPMGRRLLGMARLCPSQGARRPTLQAPPGRSLSGRSHRPKAGWADRGTMRFARGIREAGIRCAAIQRTNSGLLGHQLPSVREGTEWCRAGPCSQPIPYVSQGATHRRVLGDLGLPMEIDAGHGKAPQRIATHWAGFKAGRWSFGRWTTA